MNNNYGIERLDIWSDDVSHYIDAYDNGDHAAWGDVEPVLKKMATRIKELSKYVQDTALWNQAYGDYRNTHCYHCLASQDADKTWEDNDKGIAFPHKKDCLVLRLDETTE